MNKIKHFRNIQIFKYLYLNYFCKNIERNGAGKVIPYKNSVIDIGSNGKIILNDANLEIGVNKLKHSKAETYIRLRKNAIWIIENGASISYNSTIEVLENAKLDTISFSMNSSSVIICAKRIHIGKDVMIGRNVTIYDSNFHKINNGLKGMNQEVYIGNHVWLTSNVTVLKGVTILDGSVIGNNTLINKNIKSNQLVTSDSKAVVRREEIDWSR